MEYWVRVVWLGQMSHYFGCYQTSRFPRVCIAAYLIMPSSILLPNQRHPSPCEALRQNVIPALPGAACNPPLQSWRTFLSADNLVLVKRGIAG